MLFIMTQTYAFQKKRKKGTRERQEHNGELQLIQKGYYIPAGEHRR